MGAGHESVFVLAFATEALKIAVAGPRDRRDDRRFVGINEYNANESRRGIRPRGGLFQDFEALPKFLMHRTSPTLRSPTLRRRRLQARPAGFRALSTRLAS